MADYAPFAIKIAYAILCGGIIGYERHIHSKAAGLKTNILICLGATIYTICGSLVANGDPSRVISSIVTGIGFLGAGTIMNPLPNKVAGLTTAAIVWIVAALGILVGIGHENFALILSVVIVSITTIVSWAEKKFGPKEE